MSTTNSQKQAAKQFVKEWAGKGYEKGETVAFWMALLHDVLGVENPVKAMEFEIPVKTITKEKGSDFIDGYITATKVLIEQKGSHVDLSSKYRQSDGSELTPYQQARRYAAGLPLSKAPRWIVACNFKTFEVHDMEHPNDAPQVIQLSDLEKEYTRLSFLVDETNIHLKKELEVSIQAGEIVGVLYDKILSQYRNPDDPETQKSLNKLCVRLVFCLYAEDAGIFGNKNMFHDYMAQFSAGEFREKLIKLFHILDQKPEDRDPYEDEKLLAFPYVNGGMFAGDIEIPRINEEIRNLIIQRAADDFDWSLISPTIFGAVFESTLNPETRRAGGMHYTSIENIHKVIDPLFLDELKAELSDIKATSVAKTKRERALAFQDKLAGLKFFDPACGSGNFLTESYTSLRRLENEALRIIYGDNRVIGEMAEPIKVSINQFYGIEINDFACSVAQTALWIAESQMMQETDEIVGFNLDPLPLKTYTNIHEGNALRMDWNEVVPASELDYIMGNPPFVGARIMSTEQKDDLISVFGAKWKNIGNMDYVTGWYKKTSDMMAAAESSRRADGNYFSDKFAEKPISAPLSSRRQNGIRAALVSTNSITQGEQVANLWKPLMEAGIHIDFAWRTFIWDSEASQKAHVHCVIVGFSLCHSERKRRIYEGSTVLDASNINGYLVDAPSVAIESRSKPLSNVPEMVFGSMPNDGGFLSNYSDEVYSELIKQYPELQSLFRRLMGATEFINNEVRWCLWLKDVSPMVYFKNPFVMEAIEKVRKMRLESNRESTRKLADIPMLFGEIRQPTSNYLLVPSTSSEKRAYIPIGFMGPDVISNNANLLIPEATLYTFGILTSSIHMAWMRAVCGRLEMRYRYSAKIVYNNFPWPAVTETQRNKVEETAQMILNAREYYPDASMADLYGNLILFPDLMKAHRANDAAVLEAYGFPKDASEPDIVARLFKMYQELTTNE